MSLEIRLKYMDETGVDIHALSLTSPMVYWAPPAFGLKLAQVYNDGLAAAQEAWFALSALSERLRGVASLAQERHTHLAAQPDAPRPGRDPQELELEAETLREQEVVLGERLRYKQPSRETSGFGRLGVRTCCA